MEKNVASGGSFGALMTNLSKAFDCLSRKLLIAKIDAYGFDKKSLKFVYSHLSNRKQRVKKIGSNSSRGVFYSGFFKVHYLNH